ncbi:MAG: tRNA modification GTPase [Deltaproteobacteria bacterium]|nr:tRNA modification GTPase [Deltaproteobacteria bacterium]
MPGRSLSERDTIVARSTPQGQGAIAVIRLSGVEAFEVLTRLLAQGGVRALEPRKLHLGRICDSSGWTLDRVLWAVMPGPASYTGDDMVEIHCHGGVAVVDTLLERAVECGARLARPGEFTRRAFEAGKLDLSRAEAVSRIIEAGSRCEIRAAARALEGELALELELLRTEIVSLQAEIEAGIDFPDEGLEDPCAARCDELCRRMRLFSLALRRDAASGVPEVVLSGRVNVGKSSLINRLAGRQVAIVTAEAGTTRDAVSADLEVEGRRIRLVDTAGEGDACAGAPAREAVRVARERIAKATLLVRITEGQDGDSREGIWVVNKIDLWTASQRMEMGRRLQARGALLCSALTGEGLMGLRAALASRLDEELGPAEGIPVSVRQFGALQLVVSGLERAAERLREGRVELAAEDVQTAWDGLGQLGGETVEADVLDTIFSRFCIGK